MTTKTFKLEPLSCPSCVMKIEKVVSELTGVSKVGVLFNSSKVKVSFQEDQIEINKIKETLEKLGYPVLEVK